MVWIHRLLFLKATVDRGALDPPIFDPFVLYEHEGLQGRWLPLGLFVPLPDFRWLSWDNIGSSIAVYESMYLGRPLVSGIEVAVLGRSLGLQPDGLRLE